MQDRITQRLAQLQQDQQRIQQDLEALEHQRQGLLQQLIAVQGGCAVLRELLAEQAEPEPPAYVTYDPALGLPVAP